MNIINSIAILAGALAIISFCVVVTRQIRRRAINLSNLKQTAETVNHLLEFSQAVQGAGKTELIYPILGHYLRSELKLSGVVILTQDAAHNPPTNVAVRWPEPEEFEEEMAAADDKKPEPPELDCALCPCVRQNMPWHFTPENSPVRCMVDDALNLPKNHAAFCLPFSFGRDKNVAVHMLLEPGKAWTPQRRQLAQAYVNAAHAGLAALQLLHDTEKQSMTDALTGLFNRRSLDQLLLREVALAERHALPLTVAMVDLDQFKQINDTHGHAAGDYLLKAFADCVRITLRKTDMAFRYGGDEFVIALSQTPLQQAQQVMLKLRQAFMNVDFSHAITRLDPHPTLSMGLAERSNEAAVQSVAQMLSAADQALHAAKSSTRNCIKVYEPPKAA